MAVTPKKGWVPTQVGAAAATLYTCPTTAVRCSRCLKATATNTTVSAATLTVHIVPFGGTASTANMVTSAVSVPAGAVYEIFELEGQILSPGDFIQMLSGTASALTAHGSVVEFN